MHMITGHMNDLGVERPVLSCSFLQKPSKYRFYIIVNLQHIMQASYEQLFSVVDLKLKRNIHCCAMSAVISRNMS